MWPGFIIEGTSGEDRLQTHLANTISVEAGSSRNRWIAALLSFCAILVCFWYAGRHFSIEQRIGGHLPSTFAAFALLLAPYWFFGFGLAEALASIR